ncbi:MAG: two-component regulator propeller domain-containing protein [Bacteroidota bacterium]
MSIQKIKLENIFLFGILLLFISCKGQPSPTQKTAQTTKIAIGAIAPKLPEQIWCIHQDQKNNYWFGSNGEGAFRYDGKQLIQLTKKEGMAANQIRGIQEDKSGHIFFDTPQGVSKFDGNSLTTLHPSFSEENKWKSHPDDLWFKGNGDVNGVYRYDGKTLSHLKFPEYDLEKAFGVEMAESPYSPYGVYSIYKDGGGTLWFGTLAAGVYRFDGNSLWISEKELTVLDDGRAPGIRSIIEDKDGNFWLSNILSRYRMFKNNPTGQINYEKLQGIQPSEGADDMAFPYFMSAVTDDKNKDLWMVTYNDGVWKYDGKKLVNYQIFNGTQQAFLFSIYKDNQGVLWLGTQNAGLQKFNGTTFEEFRI